MKYSIHGFYQPKAVELGLTNDDLLVLRWFVDFAGTNKMKTIIENDGIYYWVNYSTILEDLPILKISKDWLKRKVFNNLCETKVLKHKHIKQGGSFSYYAYGINYDTLVYLQDSTPTENNPQGTEKNTEVYVGNNEPPTENDTNPYGENNVSKINLLNNTSINNTSISNTNIDNNSCCCSIDNNIYNSATTSTTTNLFTFIEKVFGRPLGSSEIEVIQTWEDSELTRYAIKQAELARAFNVRYINKILYTYQKENIKSVAEAEEREKRFQDSKNIEKIFNTTMINKNHVPLIDEERPWL